MADLQRALGIVLGEILDGSRPDAGLLLNRSDGGLLDTLDRLSAAEASACAVSGAASVAAHADHVCYDLSLLNRWSRGEEPFGDADWTASWQRLTVSDAEWAALRAGLRAEAAAFQEALASLLSADDSRAAGAVAAVAHLAYHLGAIRQIDRSARGPDAAQNRDAARRARDAA